MGMRLDLVLDRFVAVGGHRGFDLATGDWVSLHFATPTDGAWERRRSSVAAILSSLRIPGRMTLVDYGPDGRGLWVEAFTRPGPAGLDAAQYRAGRMLERDTVKRVLGQPTRQVRRGEGRPGGPAAMGVFLQQRDELDQVLEIASASGPAGPRLLAIDAPAGAGLAMFLRELAREARRLGLVPLAGRLCGDGSGWPPGLERTCWWPLVRQRHVMILDGERDSSGSGDGAPERFDVARLLGRLECAEGRRHVIVTARSLPGGTPTIALGPMSADALRRSVLSAGIPEPRIDDAITEAIERSNGWPGAFSRILRSLLHIPGTEAPYRQPEQRAEYVREDASRSVDGPAGAAAPGFDTGAVLARADELEDRGRHAAAERLLRRAIGCLTRRRLTVDAARTQLALGRLHAARGRRAAARDAFEASRELSDCAQDGDGVVRALVHLGAVLVDENSLQRAESVLRAAEAAARHGGMRGLGQAAGWLLARCLFWQGQHADAWRMIQNSPDAEKGPEPDAASVAERADAEPGACGWGTSPSSTCLPPGVTAIPAEIGVRVALCDRDAGRAARHLAAAGDRRATGDPVRAGTLFALAILVQGALGDAGTAAHELSEGLRLLRRRHAPVAAQELRIAHVEALLDAGEQALAAERLRRLLGRRSPILSGLARSRLDAIAARLKRLQEHGPADVEPVATQVDTRAVVCILQKCHEADDDKGAVAGVCQAVRSALAAASVSAFHVISGAATLAATDGGRACRAEMAERAAAALLAIGPESSAAGREAAAPVRYGGEAVGAVTARWTADAVLDGARVRGTLSAAAAAIAPAMAALARQTASSARDSGLAGELSGISGAMVALRREVMRAAAAPFPVLIQGESGTGKELIARAVHAGSARRHRRFCAVNCAALSDDLFETELFGHARGAFTGAAADRHGLFEEADGGTLFLDEVGELSPRAQAKLLRAIQEGEIRRVGENHPRRVDARIVAATNRLLGDEVRAGRFRHDLLFRLDVVRIVVPPLRERPEDIPPLALSLWRDATLRIGGRAELTPAALAALTRYDWPGNVRELQNTLAALAVHAPARGRIGPSSLPAAIMGPEAASRTEATTLVLARRRFEERFVRATLARTGGRRSEAAAALGLTRQGLAKLMVRLGIETAPRQRVAY